MKRAAPWEQSHPVSSVDSSGSDSDDDELASSKRSTKNGGSQSSKDIKPEAEPRKKKLGGMSYEALSRHGYHGGPSVLKVPPPRVEQKEPNWSWSTGKRSDADKDEESYEERERTRATIAQGENLSNVQTNLQAGNMEKKNLSFSQKEKRKRDLGQASRGKNYVEEEKRLLRESGIYSGFDS
ncbi:uncharacterized protein LOC103718092 isoform X2 [Phoenix dactylifera]|uniref:Uncharacterized protein LOC103718092 isoform X2 n=1 Tax=Phoenix dactylifera TaxID=42345 RepID=A0A8B7CRN0_PHODC|nr:uncharacterized protein LOC103718092 isoform X2 [Phoenix dactylifera]XP_008804973.1 uncharacterized protein LOC103718092 isoform X2 [Phoenix dactylifera]